MVRAHVGAGLREPTTNLTVEQVDSGIGFLNRVSTELRELTRIGGRVGADYGSRALIRAFEGRDRGANVSVLSSLAEISEQDGHDVAPARAELTHMTEVLVHFNSFALDGGAKLLTAPGTRPSKRPKATLRGVDVKQSALGLDFPLCKKAAEK